MDSKVHETLPLLTVRYRRLLKHSYILGTAKTASIEKSFSLRVIQMKRNNGWKPQEPISCAYKQYYTNTVLQ